MDAAGKGWGAARNVNPSHAAGLSAGRRPTSNPSNNPMEKQSTHGGTMAQPGARRKAGNYFTTMFTNFPGTTMILTMVPVPVNS